VGGLTLLADDAEPTGHTREPRAPIVAVLGAARRDDALLCVGVVKLLALSAPLRARDRLGLADSEDAHGSRNDLFGPRVLDVLVGDVAQAVGILVFLDERGGAVLRGRTGNRV